jgi:hypothetical protein
LDNWKKVWNLEYQESISGRVIARFNERYEGGICGTFGTEENK